MWNISPVSKICAERKYLKKTYKINNLKIINQSFKI